MAELQGKEITVMVTDTLPAVIGDYDTLVCLEDLTISANMNVNKRPTRCGVKVGTSPVEWEISGNAVTEDTPITGQVSYDQMLDWINNGTQLWVVAAHSDSGKLYVQGKAYLTATEISAPSDDVAVFSFTLSLYDTIDLAP